ncbi:MAG: LPS-assembly protein LptD [Myxococcota bacterium]
MPVSLCRAVQAVLALVALLAPGVGGAQESVLRSGKLSRDLPYRIEADDLIYEPERELYEASGNVRIEQIGGGFLQADWIVINARTHIGVATGDVLIRDGPDTLLADFAAVDLSTMVALATYALLDSEEPGFVVEAAAIHKTGVNTYRVKQGVFTTCRCPPEPGGAGHCRPWELETEQAEIRVGGYAVARDVLFRVRGWPLLYTPWLVLPVKTERQTGFLFPRLGSGNRAGASFELPFFWALRDNVNLTFRPTYIGKRGFKHGVEFEYVFGEAGEGSGGAALLPGDDEIEDTQRTPFSDNRWAYWLDHRQPLAPGLRHGVRLFMVSDNQYPLDFDDFPTEIEHARFLESSTWLTGAQGPWYASTEVAYVNDLQSPENLDRDDYLLHRLPDVRLSHLPQKLGPLALRAGGDLRYTYFYQRADSAVLDGVAPLFGLFFDTGPDALFDAQEPNPAGLFDGADNNGDNAITQGDGSFQEGELLADHGHRVDLHPRLSLPWRLGLLETLSEVGFRETLYYADRGGSERREIWTTRWDARLRFHRAGRLFGSAYRQLLVPRLAFTLVSTPDQRLNPLFVPPSRVRPRRLIDRDSRVLTRDPSDRVRDERIVQLSVDSRFLSRAEPSERTERSAPRELAALRLGSSYDLERSRVESVFINGRLSPREELDLGAEIGVDPKAGRLDEATLAASWRPESGNELTASYRFLREIPTSFESFTVSDDIFEEFDASADRVSQLSLAGRWVLSSQWELFGDGFVSLEQSSNATGLLGVLFRSRCQCWELTTSLNHSTRPSETRFEIGINLLGFTGKGRKRSPHRYGLGVSAN